VRPGLNEVVESVSRTQCGTGWLGLPVPVQLIVRIDLACLHHAGAQVVEGLQSFKLYYEECNQFALILPVSTMQLLRSWKVCNDSSYIL